MCVRERKTERDRDRDRNGLTTPVMVGEMEMVCPGKGGGTFPQLIQKEEGEHHADAHS